MTSLIPSRESNDVDGKYFNRVNIGLSKFGIKYNHVSYLNMSRHFVHRGEVVGELYEDGKHLNTEGSAKFAFELRKYLMKISNKRF